MHKVQSWAKREARTKLNPFSRSMPSRPRRVVDTADPSNTLSSLRNRSRSFGYDNSASALPTTSADLPQEQKPPPSVADGSRSDANADSSNLPPGTDVVMIDSAPEAKQPKHKLDPSVIGQLKAAILNSWVNVLLIFVPIGIALHFTSISPTVVFVANFLAIIPLAGLLSYATEEIAVRVGETLGGLLNASLGNAVELIVSIIALVKHEILVVQTSLLGSILSNLLLVLGMAFLFGGINRYEQYFNTTVAQLASSLLALAVSSLIIPTAFHWAAQSAATEGTINGDIVKLSRATAVILLIVYAGYLVFQLKTHAVLFNLPSRKVPKRHEVTDYVKEVVQPASAMGSLADSRQPPEQQREGVTGAQDGTSATVIEEEDDDAEPEPELTVVSAIILLVAVTVLVAFCAEFLVDAIDYMVTTSGISRYFVGLILLPIVGNAAEHVTSVTVACKDKMDLAIGVAVGSSMQVALLIVPFIVILGWIMGISEMTLYFDGFQVIILLVSVLLVNYLIQDGKSNFLEGLLLIAMYVIIAVASWFFPSTNATA